MLCRILQTSPVHCSTNIQDQCNFLNKSISVNKPLDQFPEQSVRCSAGAQKLFNPFVHQAFRIKVRKNFLAGKLSSNGINFSEEAMDSCY